jgi:ssDNA-binding Zn-finger/Zn-ribbon topoisomerase 1
MNTNTGEIHDALPFETLKQMADRLGLKTADLVALAKRPSATCEHCHGTGVARITPAGRRIPCDCTTEGTFVDGPAGFVPIAIPEGRPAICHEDGRQMWVEEKLENGQITLTVTLGIPVSIWDAWARAMAGRALPIKVNMVKL